MTDSWWTYIGSANGLRLQYDSADAEQQTQARILEDGDLRYGPSRDMSLVEAEYWRLVDLFIGEQ